MAERLRLDVWLVEQGYFASRQMAQRSIQAGEVFINDKLADKPGAVVAEPMSVRLLAKPSFVSRGGEKLAKALREFDVGVGGRICLDAGISTGGFTDCLLQRGAAQVYGVDVGYGQLAWSLRTDPRVRVLERTNLRHLNAAQLYGQGVGVDTWADLATVDLSFISLTKVLPVLKGLLRPPQEALLLVKPQFEAGRGHVGKKGVVRDPCVHAQAIWQVLQTTVTLAWGYRGLTWSPILGPAGNIEFWLWLAESGGARIPSLEDLKQWSLQAKADLDKPQPESSMSQNT